MIQYENKSTVQSISDYFFHSRTIACKSFHEDRPNSALRGGHPTFFLEASFCVMAWTSSMDLGRFCLTSSQAGRSQSSSPNNALPVDVGIAYFSLVNVTCV